MNQTDRARVSIDSTVQGLIVGVIEARGVLLGPSSSELVQYCQQLTNETIAAVNGAGAACADERREAVRALLRRGGYKPSGRNKPAQEYLLRTVNESGALPQILNVVDALNAVSLHSGLPISLVSIDRLGTEYLIRLGQQGENFVFNRSGQTLELLGLITLCGTQNGVVVPVGTPVKDSMLGKVIETDRDVVACIYAPANHVEESELMRHCVNLAQAFTDFCGATSTSVSVVRSVPG